jgi:asparagine synthase (glutamine-hydrolysing)
VSGLAAIVHGDGRACSSEELEPMLVAAAHRGPDGRAAWVSGPAGIGHLFLDGGLLRPRSPQPLVSDDGLLILSFDGRLDNRADLAAALDVGQPDRDGWSDADLVLAAYGSFGEGCAARLLGDFAFVLWDGRRGQLTAARDALGTRTLFYYWDGATLLVASECGQLRAHPAARLEPDESAVSDLLQIRFDDVQSTFYTRARRLPPAHVLTLRARSLALKRYWDAQAEPDVVRLSDGEYAERFRELFAEAIRCRIGSSRPVGCLLSGGVDSSAVMSMAHTVAGPSPTVDLRAFSMVFKHAPSNDRIHIQRVADRYGTAVTYSDVPRVGPLRDLDRMVRWMGLPWIDVHHSVVATLMAEARAQDCRLLLTGLRGDELFGGLGSVADLMRRLRFRSALAEVGAWAPVTGRRRTRLAWQLCLRPLARPPRRPFQSYAAQGAYDAALGALVVLQTELFEISAARFGLEPLYPFWDRRVVEFALTTPADLRASGGVTKRLLREALAGVVPEPNLERRDKLSLGPHFRRGLVEYDRVQLKERLETLHPLVQRQVGRQRVERMLADLHAGRSESLLKLWFVICVNAWLQNIEGAAPSAEPLPKALIEGGVT